LPVCGDLDVVFETAGRFFPEKSLASFVEKWSYFTDSIRCIIVEEALEKTRCSW